MKRPATFAALFVLGLTLLAPALATAQEPGTSADVADYAAREAASPGLEKFTGGFHEVLVILLIIVLIAAIVWWVMERHRP